jgi:hypothetical protein
MGHLDTLRMSVTGRTHVVYGTMKMYYHGLNVQYLVNGDDLNPSFKAKSISFFANRIVHTNNRAGKGDVYADANQNYKVPPIPDIPVDY